MIRSKLARFAMIGVMGLAIPVLAVTTRHHKLVAKPAAMTTSAMSAKHGVTKTTAKKHVAHKLTHKKAAKKLTTSKKTVSKLAKKA